MPEKQPERLANTATDRPYAVLRALASLGDGDHSLRDIAAATGLPSPTVCRLLRRAARADLVCRTQRGRYALAVGSSRPVVRLSGRRRTGDPLATLHTTTGRACLVFAATPGGGRHLVDHILDPAAPSLSRWPTDAWAALESAPLNVDAAGAVILAYYGVPRSTLLRLVRERGVATGPAPVEGWQLMAVPVWRGPVVAGCLALLVPEKDLRSQGMRQLLARELETASAAYSRQQPSRAVAC